jgi:asparagine synthase (glutamine-hydrolysing)
LLTAGATVAAPALPRPVSGWNGESHHASLPGAAFGWWGRGAPQLAEQDEVLAVVDGRFYNADEFGVAGSAAEQLITLYRRHGIADALARINGDFAAALLDRRAGRAWLARDRAGHCPLYYRESAEGVSFASRPGPLLAGSAVNRRWVAVFAGSHYRYIDNQPEESPFADVRQVPAASYVEFSSGARRTAAYWTLSEQPEFEGDEETLAASYRDLLLDSVGRRMRATSTQAFTLSGGMDSSSVLACAVATTGAKQHAFSSVYRDRTYDESDDIKTFLTDKVERWTPVPIDDFDLFGTVRRMVSAHDEPVATATWLSHFLLCERVRDDGFSSLFGGLGGDELNAGEYEYFVFNFADIRRSGDTARLEHEIREWARHHDHPIYRKNRETAEKLLAKLADPSVAGRVRVERERLGKYAGAVSRDFFDLAGFEPEHDHPFSSWLKNRTYQDIFRETAPCCLRAEDRNCSAWGLEHVDPFFDYRLMEFMFRVPGRMKIRDGVTKHLLRLAMRGILPEETRTRIKKTGWNAPAHVWFSGAGMDQVRDLVHSRVFRERGIYDPAVVDRIIAEHVDIVGSGAVRENHMMFLWQLVNLELWFQEVVDR